MEVLLKPFNLQNIQTHYEWNNDEELNFYDSEYPHMVESFDSFLSRLKQVIHYDPSVELMEIHISDTDELIGVVDIHEIDRFNKRCIVECTIGKKKYWKKGYGRDAMEKAIAYCFDDLDMNKVTTAAFDFNRRWIRLVENTGFRKEGELREHICKNGEYHDKIMFGLLKSEYVRRGRKMMAAGS